MLNQCWPNLRGQRKPTTLFNELTVLSRSARVLKARVLNKSWGARILYTMQHTKELFICKKSRPQSYFRYTLLNTQWTFCSSMSQKLGAVFICLQFQQIMFCLQLYGKWARWGRYNLYFEALKRLLFKNALLLWSRFGAWKNVTLLTLNIIKLISLGTSTSKYKKSAFSPCDYTRVATCSLPVSCLALMSHINSPISTKWAWKFHVEGEGLDPQNEDFFQKMFYLFIFFFLHYSTGLCMYFQNQREKNEIWTALLGK